MGALFGFGSVVINQTTFTNGTGVLRYEKEFLVDTKLDNGSLYQKFKWRAYVDVELPNFDSTDETNIRDLLQNINFYKENFIVAPRFSTSGIEIIMNLVSSINPEDISKNNKGQILRLSFVGVNLTETVPVIFYNQPVGRRLTEDGSVRITEDGKRRIIE